jgi:hypothetical protein
MAFNHPPFAGADNETLCDCAAILQRGRTGMAGLVGVVAWARSRALSVALFIALLVSVPLSFSGCVTYPALMHQVTEITLERDCFGCVTGSLMRLRSDGSASFSVTGKARHGGSIHTSMGRISAADFQDLVTLATANGFFDWHDTYDDPQTQDGPWTAVVMTKNGQDKRVFWRDEASPTGAAALVAAIEAVQDKTPWALQQPASR